MSDVVSVPGLSDASSMMRRRGADGPETPVRVYVCTMCNDRRRGGMKAGRLLLAELAAVARGTTVEVVPIECMSVCRPQITVTFTAQGKWTHVFAIPSNTDPAAVIEGARLYARSRTGLFPWGRCEALRTGVVARVPPGLPSPGTHST